MVVEFVEFGAFGDVGEVRHELLLFKSFTDDIFCVADDEGATLYLPLVNIRRKRRTVERHRGDFLRLFEVGPDRRVTRFQNGRLLTERKLLLAELDGSTAT